MRWFININSGSSDLTDSMIEHEYKVMMIEGDMSTETLTPQIEVTKIVDGFGFGEGGISHEERKLIVGEEVLAEVEGAIASNDILTPVASDKIGRRIDDDGCGDGRGVKTVLEGHVRRAKSLDRSKVFGGGVAMTVGMKIGLGETSDQGLQELFHHSIETLKDKQIDFGAHTDDHNSGEQSANSGCGAIDRAPFVIQNAVKYKEQITDCIAALGADTGKLDEVFANFSSYADQIQDGEYSGKKVVSEVSDNGKIVKELEHNHHEMYVLLNTVEGKTVNQELIRSISGGDVQVFGVDVWRMQELAQREYPNNTEKQNTAFLSELVYTLGVSATLTKGDLPVYLLSETQVA